MNRKNEGTSAKIGHDVNLLIYEQLTQLNQHCAAIAVILTTTGAHGFISKRDAKYYRLMVEEARALASQCIVEKLDEREVQLAAIASEQRLEIEKQLFDSYTP